MFGVSNEGLAGVAWSALVPALRVGGEGMASFVGAAGVAGLESAAGGAGIAGLAGVARVAAGPV